ncbi:MAG: hypothetical protein IH991_21545 [Planctomycetes bacterium]|nr:hypothetical protein [Planctomycetota bacterium]
MSDESFDPYRKWLGIPEKHQPPHHYRLLGIEVFESDPDVIESASNARMAHLRTFQNSKRAELSQKLLNEISSAKICLLDPDKRKSYDTQLKKELLERKRKKGIRAGPPPPKPLDAPAPMPVADRVTSPTLEETGDLFQVSGTKRPVSSVARGRRKKRARCRWLLAVRQWQRF